MRNGNPPVRALIPAALQAPISSELDRARGEQVQTRLRAHDATLWAPAGTPEVANRLGWLTIAERMLSDLTEPEGLAAELAVEGCRDVVVLGMGGSSLAPEVIRRTFDAPGGSRHLGPPPGGGHDAAAEPPALRAAASHPRLHVLDSTNAGAVRALTEAIDPRRALFLVSSKSGGTIEPLSMFAHFWELAPAGASFAAITDPGTGLEDLARQRGFRRIFHGDPDIGGRYSALSPFGIVPATLTGAPARALLEGSRAAWETPMASSGEDVPTPSRDDVPPPPAWLWLGVALSSLAREGRDKLTIVTPDSLDGLGLWLEQLFAESTGKHGKGILPVAQEPLLAGDCYGADRVFLVLDDGENETHDLSADGSAAAAVARARALQKLAEAGHPVITVPTAGPVDLGRIFMLFELCVAVAGWGLGINPFDQPNVQEAKDATARVLARIEAGQTPKAPADLSPEQLASLIGQASPPSYVALMGYMQPSPGVDAAIAELRASIMRARKTTTTFGYGPRFLHSTGQFHKGGPPTGRFLQLLHDSEPDVPVPEEAYSFTALEHAQADGDLQTLRAHGLPAGRRTLRGADPAAELRRIAAQIGEQAATERVS